MSSETTTERLSDEAVIANVGRLAPPWGGVLQVDDARHGYATFVRAVDAGDWGGDTRCTLEIHHMVEFDPSTGAAGASRATRRM